METGNLLNAIIPALEAAGIAILDESVDENGLDVMDGTTIYHISFREVAKGIHHLDSEQPCRYSNERLDQIAELNTIEMRD